jgi:hypothetical protein
MTIAITQGNTLRVNEVSWERWYKKKQNKNKIIKLTFLIIK